MKRKILTLMLFFLVGMTACGKKEPVPNEEDIAEIIGSQINANESNTENENNTSNSATNESEENVEMSKAETVAYSFLEAIRTEDYETAFSLLNIDDKTFLLQDDFTWFLPRGIYADLIGNTSEMSEYNTITDSAGNYAGTFTYGTKTFNVKATLNDENEWKIVYDEFYYADWKVEIPTECVLVCNDVEVSAEYYTEAGKDRYDIYTLPAVSRKSVNITVKTEKFGDFAFEIIPEANGFIAVCEITDTEFTNSVYDDIRVSLNEIYTGYVNGESKTFYENYVSFDTYTEIDNILTALNTFTEEKCSDATFTIVKAREDGEEIPCRVLSTDEVRVHVAIEKVYYQGYPYSKTETIKAHDSFDLKIEDEGVKFTAISNEGCLALDQPHYGDWE